MSTSSAYSLLFLPLIVGTTNIETHSTVPIEVNEDERWNFVVIQPSEEIEIVCSWPGGGLVWRLPSNNDLFEFDNIDFKSRVTEGELAGDKQARFLRITNAQPSDSGFYKCHELKNDKNYWEVYVYVKGDEPFLKPGNDSLVMSVGFIVPCRASFHVKRNDVTLFIDGVEKPELTERYDSRFGFKLYQHDLRHEIVHQRVFRCEMNGKRVEYYVEDPKLANFEDVKFEMSRTLIASAAGAPSLFSINCSLQKYPRIDLVSKHRLEIGCSSCEKKHPSVHQQFKNHSTIIVNTAPSILTADDKYFCEWYIERNGAYALHKSIALDMNTPTEKLESAGVLTSSFVGLLLVFICVVFIVASVIYLLWNRRRRNETDKKDVLVSKDKVLRVCDFGVSRIASITQCTFVTFIGTVGYEAPEMKRRENYTRKVDVYSFGVVLWEMATRRNPNTELVYKLMEESEVTKKKLPPSLLLMISKCTAMNPDERPSFAELREGVLWDAAHSDIRRNRKDWPEEKEDAQLSAGGWNYTMACALAIEHDDKHLNINK